jgi:hypothetical protein
MEQPEEVREVPVEPLLEVSSCADVRPGNGLDDVLPRRLIHTGEFLHQGAPSGRRVRQFLV